MPQPICDICEQTIDEDQNPQTCECGAVICGCCCVATADGGVSCLDCEGFDPPDLIDLDEELRAWGDRYRGLLREDPAG